MLRPQLLTVLVVGLALAVTGCNSKEPDKTEKIEPAAPSSAAVVVSAAPPVASAPKKSPIANQWVKSLGFKAPASVVHDTQSDVYLVSNVDGKPLDADGKAFISRMAPVGQGLDLKWIESGKNKVVLNAPKGMTITGDTLWVADIDTVRTFHRTTGAPTGDVKIPGATFLGDVSSLSDGRVLLTDTGMRTAKDGGLESSGTDAVYLIDKDRKVTTIAKGKDLGHPNGIVGSGDKSMWVVTMGSGELYSLDLQGDRQNVQKMPKGTLGGIAFGNGQYFVSSWEANGVYCGKPGSAFELCFDGVTAPVDPMFDRKRGLLVIPLLGEDEVRAYETQP